MYSTRKGCVKPKFERFRLRERVRVRNVCLHARHYHSAHRNEYEMKAVVILRKISKIPPQVLKNGRDKTPEAPTT